MIFPPHNVAKAILTANTEILPWPSLFHDNRKEKKKMSFGELPVTRFDVFCSVELTGQLMHYVNNPFGKGCEYKSTRISKQLSNQFPSFKSQQTLQVILCRWQLAQSMDWQPEGYVSFKYGLKSQNMGFIK